jgi:hypothetical protein
MLGPDGVQVFSVYDFLTIACNKPDKSSYANTTFFRLTQDDSEFKNELLTLCKNIKFPGKGQRETPCMTIRGLQRLLMILGGKVAAEFREIIEGTFTRVMAGDQSLIEVINANAAQQLVAPVVDEFCLRSHKEIQEIVSGWANSVFDNTPDGALKYLRHRMYVVGDMPILRYKGSWVKQKAMMYWQHRNSIVDLQVSEIRALARLSGTRVDPEKIKMAKKKHEENVTRTRGMPNYDKHHQAKSQGSLAISLFNS